MLFRSGHPGTVSSPSAIPHPANPAFYKERRVFSWTVPPRRVPFRAMRRARERSPTRLWITLGTFLAQPGSYPHKTPLPESCCRRAPHFARAAPHTLQRRKCASTLKKKRLSTQTGALYYYCYLYIKPLKNNQNPQSGHLSTAGDRPIGRLDKLTDRRLMPEWGSTGSARRSCPVDRSHP